MDYQSIANEIRAGRLAPVYFFYGDESYPIDRLARLLVDTCVDEATRDFNYDLLTAEETDGKTIADRAAAFPMMAERRFVFVKQIQKLAASDRKALLQYVTHPSEATCLVLTAGGIETRQKFYQELIQNSHWIESKPLYENQAVAWVVRQFQEQQRKITQDAALFLVEQVGTSLWALHHEIEKVLTFAPDAKSLTREEISAVAGISRQYNVWELTDAVGRKDIHSAIRILNHLLETRQSPSGMIIDLTRRITQLLQIRVHLDRGLNEEAIIRTLGMRPYFGKLFSAQARHYSQGELGAALKTLMFADHAIKTGRLDHRMTLTLVLFDVICGGVGKRFFIPSGWNF